MNAPAVHEGQQHQRQQLHHEPRFPVGDPKLDANDKVTIVGVLCTELRDYKTLDSDTSSWLISYVIGQRARVGNRRDGLETHHTITIKVIIYVFVLWFMQKWALSSSRVYCILA